MSGAHVPVSSKLNPPAPGGSLGSKKPGMVPDLSRVPGRESERIPKASSKTRPLTQYGTTEEFTGVFKQVPADQMKPEDFEQAGASFEEMRKAVRAEWPPERPLALIDPLEPAETAESATQLAAGTAAS
jgi:hypothetical protein